jgi:putative tryptophan/tyrosine transport system substrate-binding protein
MARARQPAMQMVGYVSAQTADDSKLHVTMFLQGLKETGFIDGQNAAIEYRYAENHLDRLPALAEDLVRRHVTVIAASGFSAALAAKAATATIPIAFIFSVDPVAFGIVASLNRPGGNLTGFTVLSIELLQKQLQLLRELLPNAALAGVIANPANPQTRFSVAELQGAARTLSLQLLVRDAGNDSEIESAFAAFARRGVGAVWLAPIPSMIAVCSNFRRYRSAMRCLRSFLILNTPMPVVS